MSLSIISLNTRGLRNHLKRKAIFLYCKQLNTDFCFVQETHSIETDTNFWKSQWGGDLWLSHGSERSAGVCILKNRFSGKVLNSERDKTGRYILLVLEVAGVSYIIVNAYGFNSQAENIVFFDNLEERLLYWLSKYPKASVVLGGDFNTVLSNRLDRLPSRNEDSSNMYVKTFLQSFDLTDTWRDTHPLQTSYTWSNKTLSKQSRIDLWLISKDLKNVITNILPAPLSDHKTIQIIIPSLSPGPPKTSYWKLNSTVLKHKEVTSRIESFIRLYWDKAQNENLFSTNWELLKYEISKFLRKYSSDLAKKRRLEENDTILKIAFLTSKSLNALTESEQLELTNQQLKLDEIYKRKAQGAFVRSRRKWLEEGEQNSAYFFSLEKQQSRINSIQQLRIDGTIIDDPKKISQYCAKFYSDLYSSRYCSQEASTFFNSIPNINQISEADSDFCDASISLKEITNAINQLKINKSPGTDGFTAEFYKQFSQSLAPFLREVFAESVFKGSLPPTLTQGLIALIPKPKKDCLLLDNWRPISLLNNDYKIFATILAKRLKSVLDSIIDESQSGFMCNRHISNNVRLILDLLDYSELVNEDSFVLFLDFYKAFDSLEHDFIMEALKKFGFGQFFCKSVQTLYNNGNSSIKLSNGTSPRFDLKRGVRQGCPLSVYLFLLAAQLLNLHIKHSNIKGISIANNHILISQLADDTALFLADASQVSVALNFISSFSKASGLILNLNKCELLPVNNCSAPVICNIPVKVSVTYLGFHITKDREARGKLNFLPLIEKTQKVFNRWTQRDLSLKGRVLITKAEGISRLTYAAQSLHVDNSFCKSVDKMLFNFLWKGKTHYIRKSVVLNSYNKGGLNFIDFSSLNNTFKINWIKQYLKNPTSIWNFIPHHVFSQLGGLNFILLCNYKIQKIPVKLSNFHQQVFLAWAMLYKHNFSPQRCYIWNNYNIVYKNKSLFYEKWFNNGIILVSQLFNENGLLYSYSEFLAKYKIPTSPKEFSIVFDAVPSGLRMLFKTACVCPPLSASPSDLTQLPLGKVCFSTYKTSNSKIRSLFQADLVSISPATVYWDKFGHNVDWEKVWSLPQKFLLTNKIKEISFKILHRFYPTKVCLSRFKKDIDVKCSFCNLHPETTSHLFWTCEFTYKFWKDVNSFLTHNILPDFSLFYKNVIFGCFGGSGKNNDALFLINLILFVAKFHIHKSKLCNKKPFFPVLRAELEQYISTISCVQNKKAVKTLNTCTLFNVLV
uniref:Reverse transcriptase domain-containing protein n=1 Tax=Nothobranchius pienaari TaxID=704102 RepID=A0A1A8QY68_9TELE